MKITLRIFRLDPKKDKEGHFESYEVVYEKGMRLLHAIEKVKKEKEPTLSYRWNCGAGRCGSCAVEVNGVPVLACKYEVKPGEEYTIQPMKIFPAVKDLAVDLTTMREGLKKVPGFKAGRGPFFKIYDYDAEISQEMRRCIECGICQDVCHVIREHKANFMGPRFVVKATSLDMHPENKQNRAKAMEKFGLGYCNVTKCCQSVCPEKIRITDDAIIPMKEKITSWERKEFFRKIFCGKNEK